jgi:HEPN domain-containing protein
VTITRTELRKLAVDRLADARALLDAGRWDGASYLAGYVVELSLKARICKTLKWAEFPVTRKEFERFQSFKTHDLDSLLRLSARESYVKAKLFTEWSTVQPWDPEQRYQPTGQITEQSARAMVGAAAVIARKP